MSELLVNQEAPGFTLPASETGEISLSQFRGQKVVLYFYPRDNTPGCTQEALEFKEAFSDLSQLGVSVLGISRDKPATHEKFQTKYELPFILLSDTNEAVCQLYGVLKDKVMYGKKVRGIERSTFIIDEQGKIAAIFRKVKPKVHASVILEFFRQTGTAM